MRPIRRVALAVAAAAMLAVPAPASAAARTSSATYTAPAVATVPIGCEVTSFLIGDETALPTGGGCFAVEPGEATVSFLIFDETHLPVAGLSWFDGPTLTERHEELHCGSGQRTIPSGATRLIVTVDVITVQCAGSAPATTGTITATFRDAQA